MKLENQVCSSKLSNKLRKLGITTPSIFYREWTGAKDDEIEMWKNNESYYGIDNVNCYTVAELGEMLLNHYPFLPLQTYPVNKNRINVNIDFNNRPDLRTKFQKKVKDLHSMFDAKTEANARAKMLIYLLENNLLNKKE